MAIIPANEKVFMVSNGTNTTYSGSAALKAMQQWYTMQDVSDSVQPYKVFTALLTQSGGNTPLSISGGTATIGVTYEIQDNSGGGYDFTNIGAPNNISGTSFIATGTTPNSWGDGQLNYNTGTPVVTVLENTIGNIWFEYGSPGDYLVRSSDLFLDDKTTLSINLMGDDPGLGYLCLSYILNINELGIVTGTQSGPTQDNILVWKTPIEIRVYN